MARASVVDGVSVLACTPHILPGLYHNVVEGFVPILTHRERLNWLQHRYEAIGQTAPGCGCKLRQDRSRELLAEMPNAGLIGSLTTGLSISWLRMLMILSDDLRI